MGQTTKVTITVILACFILLVVNPGSPLPNLSYRGGEVMDGVMSLLHNGTVSAPSGRPTAFVSPVYPALYASVIRLCGDTSSTLWIMWLVNFLFIAVALGLLPLTSHKMGFGLYPGIVAAFLGVVGLHLHVDTNWEVFLATLLSVAVFAQLTYKPTTKRAVFLGLSLGLLIFTQPAFSLLLLPWSFIWLYGHPQMVRRIVLVGGLAALVITPWLVRNYRQFGEFIFIRDGFGLELYVSNNADAAPSFNENMTNGSHMKYHPNLNARIARDLAQAGEYNYFQSRKKLAVAWIEANPSRFSLLTLKRIRLFWFPTPDPLTRPEGVLRYCPWLVTALSVFGLWLLYRDNRRAALLLGTALTLYPLVYYVVQFDVRYRYPIYWMSLLLAGIAVNHFCGPLRAAFGKLGTSKIMLVRFKTGVL
jgi:hypothetical protein